jgi:hypothetical protein
MKSKPNDESAGSFVKKSCFEDVREDCSSFFVALLFIKKRKIF